MLLITWTLTALLSLAFVGAGLAKLLGRPTLLPEFGPPGPPLWSAYASGTIEIACALLVLFPRSAPLGAGILACGMAAALGVQLAKGHGEQLVAPFWLLLLALAVGTLRGWGRRDPFAWSRSIDRR